MEDCFGAEVGVGELAYEIGYLVDLVLWQKVLRPAMIVGIASG